jgi:hypothetical protein
VSGAKNKSGNAFLSLLIDPVTKRLSKIKNVTKDKNARNTFTVKCKVIP